MTSPRLSSRLRDSRTSAVGVGRPVVTSGQLPNDPGRPSVSWTVLQGAPPPTGHLDLTAAIVTVTAIAIAIAIAIAARCCCRLLLLL